MLRALGVRLAEEQRREDDRLRFFAALFGVKIPDGDRAGRDQHPAANRAERGSPAASIRKIGGDVTRVRH